VKAVAWDDALADLQRFVPTAVGFSSPDRLWAAADALAGPAVSRKLSQWEDLPDLEILDRVFAGQPALVGPVVVVTDHMFSSGGSPARLPAERLREFVAGYLVSAGQCFFNGDVVIVAADVSRLTVFHHEGVFAHWDLGQVIARTRGPT
jgi:hypothetical protein